MLASTSSSSSSSSSQSIIKFTQSRLLSFVNSESTFEELIPLFCERGLIYKDFPNLNLYLLKYDKRKADLEDKDVRRCRGLVFDSLKAAHLRKKGSFLKGNDDKGWILTSLGLEFCKNAKIKFNRSIVSKKRITKSEKNFLSREEDRILHSSAFDKFYNNKVKDITEEDIKFLFKVDDYTSRSDVEKRIINMLDNFKNKESVYKLINTYKEEVVNYVK